MAGEDAVEGIAPGPPRAVEEGDCAATPAATAGKMASHRAHFILAPGFEIRFSSMLYDVLQTGHETLMSLSFWKVLFLQAFSLYTGLRRVPEAGGRMKFCSSEIRRLFGP
jgi:hypothetical protein